MALVESIIEYIKSNLTIVVAIYGAFFSSIAIIWNILKDANNRAKIRVTAGVGIVSYAVGASPKTVYNFEAVNTGVRPVTLSSVGIALEGDRNIHFLHGTNLPKKLSEGDKVLFYRFVDDEEFMNDMRNNKPKYLWFRDSQDRTYKSKSVAKLFSMNYTNPSQ